MLACVCLREQLKCEGNGIFSWLLNYSGENNQVHVATMISFFFVVVAETLLQVVLCFFVSLLVQVSGKTQYFMMTWLISVYFGCIRWV